MLDFDTCKQCCAARGMPFSYTFINWSDIGTVYCPIIHNYMSPDQDVPDWCPCALEHIMKEADA